MTVQRFSPRARSRMVPPRRALLFPHRFSLPRRWLPDVQFLWRRHDGLTPAVGPALAITRNSNITEIDDGLQAVKYSPNVLPQRHGVFRSYYVHPRRRTDFGATWYTTPPNGSSAANSGIASPIRGKNYWLIKALDHGSVNYHFREITTASSFAAGDKLYFKFYVKQYGSNDYAMFECYDSAYRSFSFRFSTGDFPYSSAAWSSKTAKRISSTEWVITAIYTVQASGIIYVTLAPNVDGAQTGDRFRAVAPNDDVGFYIAAIYFTKNTGFWMPLAFPDTEDNSAYLVAASSLSCALPQAFSGAGCMGLCARGDYTPDKITDLATLMEFSDGSSNTDSKKIQFRTTPALRMSMFRGATEDAGSITDAAFLNSISGKPVSYTVSWGKSGARLMAYDGSSVQTAAFGNDHTIPEESAVKKIIFGNRVAGYEPDAEILSSLLMRTRDVLGFSEQLSVNEALLRICS